MRAILSILFLLCCLHTNAQNNDTSPVGRDIYLAYPLSDGHAHLFQIKKKIPKVFKQEDINDEDFYGKLVHVDSIYNGKMQSYYFRSMNDDAVVMLFTYQGQKWAYVNPRAYDTKLWEYYNANDIEILKQQWIGKTVSLALTPRLSKYNYYQQMADLVMHEEGIDFLVKDIIYDGVYENKHFNIVLEGKNKHGKIEIPVQCVDEGSKNLPTIRDFTCLFRDPKLFRQVAYDKYDSDMLDSLYSKYTGDKVYLIWFRSLEQNPYYYCQSRWSNLDGVDTWFRSSKPTFSDDYPTFIPCKFEGFSAEPCYIQRNGYKLDSTYYEIFARFSYLPERHLREGIDEHYIEDTLMVSVDTAFFHDYLFTKEEFRRDSIKYAKELANDIKIQNLVLQSRRAYTDELWKNGRPNPNFTTEQMVEAKLGKPYKVYKVNWPMGVVTVYDYYLDEEKYYFYRNKLVGVQFNGGGIIRNGREKR